MATQASLTGRLRARADTHLASAVQRMMSSDRVVLALQAGITTALRAKSSFDGVSRVVLVALGLPTTADVDTLKDRLDQLDRAVDRLESALERPARP